MEHIINLRIDDMGEMAEIYLNGECIMLGNFWDFHPGVLDLLDKKYGEFKGYNGLINAIREQIEKEGHTTHIIKERYSYDSH